MNRALSSSNSGQIVKRLGNKRKKGIGKDTHTGTGGTTRGIEENGEETLVRPTTGPIEPKPSIIPAQKGTEKPIMFIETGTTLFLNTDQLATVVMMKSPSESVISTLIPLMAEAIVEFRTRGKEISIAEYVQKCCSLLTNQLLKTTR